jgi:Tol biopolymer transport system component
MTACGRPFSKDTRLTNCAQTEERNVDRRQAPGSSGGARPSLAARRNRAAALVAALPLLFVCLTGSGEGEGPPPPRLLLAFASYRDRAAFTNVYFYEHDGLGQGRLLDAVPAVFERADYHPSLTADGAICAYAAKQVGGFPGLIQLWDLRARRPLERPGLNEGFGARLEPSLSGDGRLLAFTGWERPGGAGGWDAFLYDLHVRQFVGVPGLNTQYEERELTLSGDGRYLAFVSNRPGGKGLSDIYLYERSAQALVPLPGLNTRHRELNPALSADGRLVAFVSDRPGGSGGKDIYLYDRQTEALLPLPGLNSVAHEQTPALSPDGRFIAFVSERISGAGERDLYLYDRRLSKLLRTPGLNSKKDDFDPSLAYLR